MIRRFFAIVTILLVPAQALADQTDPPAIDPKAAAITTASFDFIASQPAMTVSWFITYDRIFEGREKITFIRSGTNTLARGKGFRSYSEHDSEVREYVYDGERFTVSAPNGDFYATTEVSGDFDTLVTGLKERHDLVLPLWSVMSAQSADEFFDDVERATYLGTTLVNGQGAHHIAFSEYAEDFQLWISTDPERPVPLMIVGTEPYKQGWPQYSAFLYDWTLSPELPEDFFAFVPDDDDVEIGFSSLVVDPDLGEPVKAGSE